MEQYYLGINAFGIHLFTHLFALIHGIKGIWLWLMNSHGGTDFRFNQYLPWMLAVYRAYRFQLEASFSFKECMLPTAPRPRVFNNDHMMLTLTLHCARLHSDTTSAVNMYPSMRAFTLRPRGSSGQLCGHDNPPKLDLILFLANGRASVESIYNSHTTLITLHNICIFKLFYRQHFVKMLAILIPLLIK